VELLLCTDIVLRVVLAPAPVAILSVVAVPLAAHVVSCTHSDIEPFHSVYVDGRSTRDTVRVKGYEMPLPQLRFERC
jgi:hypothetical protein